MERRTAVFASALALCAGLTAAVLSSCATRLPVPGPRVEIGPVRTEALDQHRVRFSFEVRAANPGSRTLPGLSLDCLLELPDGPAVFESSGPAGALPPGGPFALAPGEIRTENYVRVLDFREFSEATGPGADEIPWRIGAALSGPGPAGTPETLGSASAEGTFPRVREPILTIRSIVLVRHELVNVLLELVLDVENPNAFPVEFSAVSYRFHGEGRKWASGSVERAVPVPARGKAEVRLPILLNFTETGRDLFDLVAKLRVVRFRLEGRATVSAPVPFLPEFRMDFDRSGAVQVERTHPAGP